MAQADFAEMVASLTPEEQNAVRELVEFLRRPTEAQKSPFVAAAKDFIRQHPELLRRLAQ